MAETQKLEALAGKATLMTPKQRDIVDRDIRVLERALHGEPMQVYSTDNFTSDSPGPSGAGTVMMRRELPVPDRANLEKNLQAATETKALNSAPDLSDHAKSLLFQRYKEECRKFKEGNVSHGQMWKATRPNLQMYMRHKEANKKRGQFIMNVHRILEPDDDMFSLEDFRPENAAPFNPVAFRAGYDRTRWVDDKELELQKAELTDDVYKEFLEALAGGLTTDALLQKKLALSKVQVAACRARLEEARAEHAQFLEANPEDDPPAPDPMDALDDDDFALLDAYGEGIVRLASEGPCTITHLADMVATRLRDEHKPVPKPKALLDLATKLATAMVATGQVTQDGETLLLA